MWRPAHMAAGAALCYLVRRPRSTVKRTAPDKPWNLPEAAPIPTSRQRLRSSIERCELECIHAVNIARGVPRSPAPQPITSDTAHELQPLRP